MVEAVKSAVGLLPEDRKNAAGGIAVGGWTIDRPIGV